ncbi:hypothetical protein QQP08_016928 [Theobroma cacao]|nr:hypothetical protein QQP08_016928 [Theobroma cacao]
MAWQELVVNSMLMENFLRSKDFWQMVSVRIEDPAIDTPLSNAQKAKIEGLKLKDLKQRHFQIDLGFHKKKKFHGLIRAKRWQLQTLRLEFETLRLKIEESVSEFFSSTMAIINKMCVHGEKIEHMTVVEKILRSMTPKFNYVVCAIDESKDLDDLSIDELQGSLLVHEQKLSFQDKREQALKASSNNSSSTSNSSDQGRGKGRRRGKSRDRGNQNR